LAASQVAVRSFGGFARAGLFTLEMLLNMTSANSIAGGSDHDEDLLEVIEDEVPGRNSNTITTPWKVLIVDDEADVHQTTRLALRGLTILGREIHFLDAYSAADAREIISREDDLAMILLDVVMESERAGLDLVKVIRDEFKREDVRIILRTGQPGYAPEIDTIRTYDINDYKTKSELTRVRLYTSMTVGLRSYQQIKTLQQSRHGLELIVSGSTELSKLRGLQKFAEGVVTQLCALLGMLPDGLICAQGALEAGEAPRIIAAAGQYSGLMHLTLAQVGIESVRVALERCLQTKQHLLGDQCCLYFSASSGRAMAAYINSPRVIDPLDQSLLQVFCSSISVGMENVLLYSQLLDYAYIDQLLKLPNRIRFVELIDQNLKLPDGITLALVDIDDFAGINTTLGHRFGDMLLRAVSDRLGQAVGANALMARVSGDTFGLLGPDALVNPQSLNQVFAKPFDIGTEHVRVSASFGLVRLGVASPNGAELLKDAQLALKRAKNRQRGSAQYFSDNMGVHARERVRLLHSLHKAFEDRRLYIAYQPLVMLDSGRAVGVEALIRWRQENGDFVSPERFIPLAEHSGLIVSIGEFVLRTALHQLHRLHTLGYSHLRMAVNVSQIQLREPGFVTMLKQALIDTRANPRDVELEITESTAMDDVEFMMSMLADLRATGVSVAIDDFGTGYSSLSALRQLGAHRLKIDKAFVHQMNGEEDHGAIALMVIDLAQNLQMEVIAEGVETVEQKARLLAMGCPQGQGYLFARPMPADQLEVWLAGAAS
jgi:diguanylate cyclase